MINKPFVKLSFELNPVTQYYHSVAFPMGIIQGNAEVDITPWLCNRHVNCMFLWQPNIRSFDTNIVDPWCKKANILKEQQISLYKGTYKILDINFIVLFKKILCARYYVTGFYNEKYIPVKGTYQKKDNVHDFILYGYDDDKKVFFSAGYYNGRYSPFEIPYENMNMSLSDMPVDVIKLKFLEYNNNCKFLLNLPQLVTELDAYINSTNSRTIASNDRTFGLKAMERLKEYFISYFKENGVIDSRYTRAYMEHKYFMYLRLKYLSDNGFAEIKHTANRYTGIYNNAVQIHNLGTKLSFTGDVKIMDRIVSKMDEIAEFEAHNLPSVVNCLKEHGYSLP